MKSLSFIWHFSAACRTLADRQADRQAAAAGLQSLCTLSADWSCESYQVREVGKEVNRGGEGEEGQRE